MAKNYATSMKNTETCFRIERYTANDKMWSKKVNMHNCSFMFGK